MRFFPRYSGPPLIEQIVAVENLTLAWRRVRSNIRLAQRGRSAGADAVTIEDFERDWTRQISTLADELRHGSYRALPPRQISIPKPSGGERAIAILAVRDRIAQRAVQQVLEPLFDPLLLDCAYGCRPGVGVPQALERVARYADQGLVWVVDADISDYFASIDQRILLGLLRQRVDDLAVLRLISQWLASGALHQPEHGPVSAPATPLGRARQAARRMLDRARPPAAAWRPAVDPIDSWPPDVAAGQDDGRWDTPHGGWEHTLWNAAMWARPALRGAQAALPYARRIGGQRLALAGAVAAGTLVAGEMLARRWMASGRGTPQGGALSPLLANVYLHPFDLALTGQGLRLVRFVDDFVIMCPSQPEADAALELARGQLHTLRLQLHPDKTRILPYADGFDFLGQALAPRPRGARLAAGAASFGEAEQALRAASASVRQRLRRR